MLVVGGLILYVYHVVDVEGREEVISFSLNHQKILLNLFSLVLLYQVDRADLSGNHVVSCVGQMFDRKSCSKTFLQVNIAGALMSIGAGLEFFKTLRVGNCKMRTLQFIKSHHHSFTKGGVIVRIPWSSGPLRYHSLQAPGKDHHHCHPHPDLLIRCYYH